MLCRKYSLHSRTLHFACDYMFDRFGRRRRVKYSTQSALVGHRARRIITTQVHLHRINMAYFVRNARWLLLFMLKFAE